MDTDIKKQEITKLWAWMSGGADEPEAVEALLTNFEGRYPKVAQYVNERLEAELPERWRWLAPFIDHTAVGERWISLGMLLILDPNTVIAHGQPPYADEAAGVFIFRGKG
jgi:hypothetical protein